jgi:tRNA modification GTPase
MRRRERAEADDVDTIAAIATASGGGVGIIRVSGPEAISLLKSCFRPTRGGADTFPQAVLRHGRLMVGMGLDARSEALDEGLAVAFHAPRSLTGEDVVELHLHGGALHLGSCLEALLATGRAIAPGRIRLARPGEFLERAFLAGKLDLTRAEAIADLIGASSSRALAMARHHLAGALEAAITNLREGLLMAAAELEAHIDFVDEGLPHLDRAAFDARLAEAEAAVVGLLATTRLGAALREGARVALVGAPNVGKSSLFNALVGAERAIVSPIPGTTRDTLREPATIGGVPVLLCDTAGLRQTADPIEAIGVARAEATLAEADVVLHVVGFCEARGGWPEAPLPHPPAAPVVRALSKADLAPPDPVGLAGGLPVSAHTGEGLATVAEAIANALGAANEEGVIVGRARHRDALTSALSALERTRGLLADPSTAALLELSAFELHDAIAALGSILGETTIEDVLDRVFSTFCIGK